MRDARAGRSGRARAPARGRRRPACRRRRDAAPPVSAMSFCRPRRSRRASASSWPAVISSLSAGSGRPADRSLGGTSGRRAGSAPGRAGRWSRRSPVAGPGRRRPVGPAGRAARRSSRRSGRRWSPGAARRSSRQSGRRCVAPGLAVRHSARPGARDRARRGGHPRRRSPSSRPPRLRSRSPPRPASATPTPKRGPPGGPHPGPAAPLTVVAPAPAIPRSRRSGSAPRPRLPPRSPHAARSAARRTGTALRSARARRSRPARCRLPGPGAGPADRCRGPPAVALALVPPGAIAAGSGRSARPAPPPVAPGASPGSSADRPRPAPVRRVARPPRRPAGPPGHAPGGRSGAALAGAATSVWLRAVTVGTIRDTHRLSVRVRARGPPVRQRWS